MEEYVTSPEEIYELMAIGAENRVTAATSKLQVLSLLIFNTGMNAQSSRSHSIFIITLTQRDTVQMGTKTGKLFLVDLAGSEKVKKTNAQGQQLEVCL